MTVAIDYYAEKSPEALHKVFGMQVAIFNWLKAWFRYGQQETFTFLIENIDGWNEVQTLADSVGLDRKRLQAFDRRFVQENYGQLTTVFRPDPVAKDILWRRETLAGAGYNFCGLAHAISGLETGELLEQYCLAPTDASDAIICPSRAVQAAIRSFFDSYQDYLKQRFGCDYHCPIQLPVIPLGIDVEKYAAMGSADKRAEQRQKLGVAENDIVLLWVGRLSHAIKAHPLSMFQAAERAAEMTGAKVHLVMLGYFVPEDDAGHFRKLADALCHKATVTFVPNRDERFPDGLWAAGDIFLSLIDNMQESFGLTPIEAMAVGLPRVISDWDGYKDSVNHGEDGFLVRTLQPPVGSGQALSTLLLDGVEQYGGYLAKTALSVAVDTEQAASFIARLIEDKNLRASMAAKAKQRVKDYGWSRIIPAYEAFWSEMAAKRRADHAHKPRTKWAALPPQAPDPFTMYASYPSAALTLGDRVSIAASPDRIRELFQHHINVFGIDMMTLPDETLKIIHYISSQGTTNIGNVFQQCPTTAPPRLWRTMGWLIKLGIVRHGG